MKASKILRTISVLLVVIMLFAACSGGGDSPASDESNNGNTSSSEGSSNSSSGGGDTTKEEAPTAAPTATPEPTIPDILVIHPEATEIEITEATDTYVYIIPGMVAEATEYFQEELAALGWEGLGRPTVMGHIATLNMQQEGYRLTVSMQDNEHSMTTRVQMLLLKQ